MNLSQNKLKKETKLKVIVNNKPTKKGASEKIKSLETKLKVLYS